MTILLFLIIFSIIVISHEFGHLIVARKNGIHVVEFSIGMGPKIFSKHRNGTNYVIRILPFGGMCIFEGTDTFDTDEVESDGSFMVDSSYPPRGMYGCKYQEASVWSRIATTLAGPFFNILLGFLFAVVIVGFEGTDLPVVNGIMSESAAEEAGMRSGDLIKEINGESIHVFREVSLYSSLNKDGEPMDITYERDGAEYVAHIVPKFDEVDNRYYIGFQNGGLQVECTGLDVFKYGYYESVFIVRNTIKSIGMLITGQLSKDDVSGPVGMANFVGEAYEQVKVFGLPTIILTMMNIVVILSINLGIMNLLPIPGLDGGKMLFLILELIRRKPLPQEKEGYVNLAGFVLLFLIMIFVLYNDIMRVFM